MKFPPFGEKGPIPKNPFVCPKKVIIPTFLFFSDGIGTRKILFDREGSGFLGYCQGVKLVDSFGWEGKYTVRSPAKIDVGFLCLKPLLGCHVVS